MPSACDMTHQVVYADSPATLMALPISARGEFPTQPKNGLAQRMQDGPSTITSPARTMLAQSGGVVGTGKRPDAAASFEWLTGTINMHQATH